VVPLKTRILLADDHAVVRGGLRLLLNAEPDMEVVAEAGDGLEAVERAVRARPEIVFLDIDMPRLNGIEACRRLRSDPATAGATIVMLTGETDGGVERDAVAAGADLFLTKPFSPLHLLQIVDALGRRLSA
jgi:CheY-like chemotaxis protein